MQEVSPILCDPGTAPEQKAAALEAIVNSLEEQYAVINRRHLLTTLRARSQYAELGSTDNQKRVLAMLEDRVEGFRDGLGAASSVDPLLRKWIEEFETSAARA